MDERITLEVVHNAVLLHLSEEHAKSVKVIFGGADGTLIYIDYAGHIGKIPPEGPGDPQVRKAVASIVEGIRALLNLSQASLAGAAA